MVYIGRAMKKCFENRLEVNIYKITLFAVSITESIFHTYFNSLYIDVKKSNALDFLENMSSLYNTCNVIVCFKNKANKTEERNKVPI